MGTLAGIGIPPLSRRLSLRSAAFARSYTGSEKPNDTKQLQQEWIDEWAGGGSVTGEPSTSLRGSFQLTLVPRERKRRDSNRGLVITTASKLCGLTYVSMIHRR